MKDETIAIKKIFKLNDKLEGRFLSSNSVKCIPDKVNDNIVSESDSLTLDRLSNFKWKINYSPRINQTVTRLTSSFFEGEINPSIHSVITMNSLKIIGKSINLKYNLNNTEINSQCVIFENLDILNPDLKYIPQVNHSIKVVIIAIMIIMIIILFLLVAFLRKNRKSENDGFRVVDLSTSVGNKVF